MPHVALEDRDPAIPPCDSLAEAIVLLWLLEHPRNLQQYDVRPLLVFPEHRVCLDAMQSAHDTEPGQPWGRFYVRWVDELERAMPGHSAALEDLLLSVADDSYAWRWARYDEDHDHTPQPIRASDYSHDWHWWLERIKRIAEARRLIASAQEIAERAWHMDLDGAWGAMPAGGNDAVGMTIP